MEIIHGLEKISKNHKHAIVALGFFDGFHQGHKALILHAKKAASASSPKTPVLLYTFDRHPLEIINPSQAPLLLSTLPEKIQCAGQFPIDFFLIGKFDYALSQLEPDQFLKRIIKETLDAKGVVIGYNYRYGKGQEGNAATLNQQSKTLDLSATVVNPVQVDEIVVSSTKIRSLLLEGDVKQAASFLGRRYSMEGKVVRGNSRGKALGIPTANLELPHRKLAPKPGIYAALTRWRRKIYGSLVSIGNSPTFGGTNQITEVHLLDFNQNIYGQVLQVEFVEFRRGQEKFSSPAALVKAMHEDIAWGREILEKHLIAK